MEVYKRIHLAVPLFLAFFGVMFVVFGIRRMLQAKRGAALDALVWGTIGICAGLGFFYGAYWFFKPG
ncbi:MAG TPA: hypothetical protein VN541_18820 [Tepidisphaeraceae bacterium]|nr:hypothetical protein [Tepidisphaeraceae bacterium]